MSSRRQLRALLWLGLTLVTVSHCRQVSLCDQADRRCQAEASAGSAGTLPGGSNDPPEDAAGQGGAPDAASAGHSGEALGGSSESQAGDAGQAGDASGVECTKPYGNCDATPLNGCETYLATDPNHCGACDTRCDGLCVSSTCLPFEVLGKYALQSNLVVSDQFLYFVTGESFTSERLVRVDSLGKQTETLAQNLLDFHNVAVGTDRVYLWSSELGLWSVSNGSHVMVDEGIKLDWFGVNREYSFWLNSKVLHRRRVGAPLSEETAWRELGDASPSDLAVEGSYLFLLQRGDPDRISRLGLYDDAPQEPELLVSENGDIVRFRVYDGALYWIAHYAEGGLEHDELSRLLDSGKPELLLSAPQIGNFAVNRWVFAFCPGLAHSEIQAFDPAHLNAIHHLGVLSRPSAMEVDENDRLWLFDFELSRLLSSDISWSDP